MRRQRTLCGIRIKSFGTPFVSAPLCVDSDLCDPDRNQSAVVGCFERTPLCENCDLCDQKQSQPTQQHFVCCTMYGMVLLQQRVDHKQHNHTHTNGTRRNKKRGGTRRGIITGIPRREVCSHTPITLATMKTMKETLKIETQS